MSEAYIHPMTDAEKLESMREFADKINSGERSVPDDTDQITVAGREPYTLLRTGPERKWAVAKSSGPIKFVDVGD